MEKKMTNQQLADALDVALFTLPAAMMAADAEDKRQPRAARGTGPLGRNWTELTRTIRLLVAEKKRRADVLEQEALALLDGIDQARAALAACAKPRWARKAVVSAKERQWREVYHLARAARRIACEDFERDRARGRLMEYGVSRTYQGTFFSQTAATSGLVQYGSLDRGQDLCSMVIFSGRWAGWLTVALMYRQTGGPRGAKQSWCRSYAGWDGD